MDPVTLGLLVTGLGNGLVAVLNKLAEKGVIDPIAERTLGPVVQWLERGYDAKEEDEALRSVLLSALKVVCDSHLKTDVDKLVLTLRLTNLGQEQHAALAAATVEMSQYDPQILPTELLKSLKLEENQRALLAEFLFEFRRQLAQAKDTRYPLAIAYANAMATRGALDGLTGQMLDLQNQTARLVTLQETLMVERKLTTDDEAALNAYLLWARQRWGSLMLPLIRKRSGDVVSAQLKQVYVPLLLRNLRAEEAAGQKKKWRSATQEQLQEEEVKPITLGELLQRYPRFILIGTPGCGKTTLLHRLALAFAEGRFSEDLSWQGPPLFPIFARLRNFGAFLAQQQYSDPGPASLVAYLNKQLKESEGIAITPDFFEHRLQEGRCLVLLDGLDEVSENRSEVVQHICAFINHYGHQSGNRFGLSSRPRGFETVERQLRPANLAVAEVRPLEPRGIRELIFNLLALIEPDNHRRDADCDELARTILASPDLTEIASTPLFCAALVQVYKYHGAHLPERRVDVLDEIIDLLLGFWKAQETTLTDAERLAMADGTTSYRRMEDAVTIKRLRLSWLAYQMQLKRIVDIDKDAAVDLLAEYLKERERIKDEDTCCEWAENFLVNSHERSGLLVEREPERYSFLHKSFMEFLAATWLINRNQVIPAALENVEDDWWEPVILLAGAHPNLSESFRSELINQLLDQAETAVSDVPAGSRHLLMAGRLTTDMAEYLPGADHERVEECLKAVMIDPALKPTLRADAADALDGLGWQPEDLYRFVPVPDDENPCFWIGACPVTNLQYVRFMDADDFVDRELWIAFTKFDACSQAMKEDWGEVGWEWLQGALQDPERSPDGKKVPPRYWSEARFGIARKCVPVVSVTWFEANAYCAWLLRHWNELPESRSHQGQCPAGVRLPTEVEWLLAAGGERGERYPWDTPGQATRDPEQILRRTNIDESGIHRTTPVGLYPLGRSHPYKLWDMAGNVWEWQANNYDKDHNFPSLRGGSWNYSLGEARCTDRYRNHPDLRFDLIGFRCVLSVAP